MADPTLFVKNLTPTQITGSDPANDNAVLISLMPQGQPGDRGPLSWAAAISAGFQALWAAVPAQVAVFTDSGYTTQIANLSGITPPSNALATATTAGIVKQGAAVAASTDTSNAATQLNALIASLKTAGVIASS